VPDAAGCRRLLDRASRLARDWPKLSATEVRQMLLGMLSRVSPHADRIDLHVRPDRLPPLLIGGPEAVSLEATTSKVETSSLVLSVQALRRESGSKCVSWAPRQNRIGASPRISGLSARTLPEVKIVQYQ
jgi:hypothetical protein